MLLEWKRSKAQRTGRAQRIQVAFLRRHIRLNLLPGQIVVDDVVLMEVVF